jgi:hypothetical protein
LVVVMSGEVWLMKQILLIWGDTAEKQVSVRVSCSAVEDLGDEVWPKGKYLMNFFFNRMQ